MSDTLKEITGYLNEPLKDEGGVIDFPFDVESFCRDNDLKVQRLEANLKAMAEFALTPRGVCRCSEYPHSPYLSESCKYHKSAQLAKQLTGGEE